MWPWPPITRLEFGVLATKRLFPTLQSIANPLTKMKTPCVHDGAMAPSSRQMRREQRAAICSSCVDMMKLVPVVWLIL